jgi:pimeloyl-ACP methyl ester carboxylesterase
VPLGWLVTHRFDNRAGLASLGQRGGHAWVFHGTDDEVIPVRMARLLTSEAGPTANFEEIPGGRHNNLLETGFRPIGAAMQAARKEG